MMRFRLHSMVAVLVAILLLPALALSQEPTAPAADKPAASAPDKSAPETGAAATDKIPAAPIEPVMSGPYPVMSKAAQDRGRQVFQMFNNIRTGEMWASLSEGLRKQSGKEERFVTINKKLRERLGKETAVVEENFVPYIFAPDTVYSRLANFSGAKVPVMFMVTINQRGQIDSFTINPMAPVAEGRYAGYQDVNKLKLPFAGEWLVYQGGRSVFDNGYAQSDDQRFAIDFVPLQGGRMFSGKGGIFSSNEDYYCFGKPVLAAADGTVAKAEMGYNDNPPGKPTGDPADGNMVIISHGNGESSMMNHLKQNSLKVKRGDVVKQGDVIGECGNSGSGPVPHLHYALQKSAGVQLPAAFTDYVADGKPVASGEPKRGQMVKNGTATPASDAGAAATTAPATTPPAQK